MDTEKIKKKDIEIIRDLLRNGAPEWLVLFLTVKNRGTIGNQTIRQSVSDDINAKLSNSRLSQARKNLIKNGLKKCRTFGGVYYELEPELENQYARFFDCVFAIINILEKTKDYKDLNRLKKRGIIKRR